VTAPLRAPARVTASLPPAPGPDALFTRFRPALWRYLRVLGCDPATADDLVQEVFVVVLQRPQFEGSRPGAAFAFLRAVARHRWLKSRRRKVAERDVEEADRVWDARCGDGDGDGQGYVDALRQCLDGLPERSRTLLQATYGDGDGRAASASRFGMSQDGIKSALRRLRAFLHECIERRRREAP